MSDLVGFRFAELSTPEPLRSWFLTWWEFRVGSGAPGKHHVPPDGCTNLILANPGTATEKLFALGPFVEPRVVPTHPGMRTVGIRLHPAAAPVLLGKSAERLANRMEPITTVAGLDASIVAEVLRQPDLDSVAAAGATLLNPLADRLPPTDPLATRALQTIRGTAGGAPLPAIAARLGVSPRTLLRRVKAATGLTPKQHARIARFFTTAHGMLDPDHRLSTLAAQGGYADQPHFHHEVTALTGLTPAQLAERVRQTEHRLS